MRAAAASIPSNIAEGFGRGGNAEFRQFLAVARGSAVELKTQLYLGLDAGYLDQAEFDTLYSLAHDERLIGGFMRYLGQTGIKGQKFK